MAIKIYLFWKLVINVSFFLKPYKRPILCALKVNSRLVVAERLVKTYRTACNFELILQKEELGFEHQESTMPSVPDPDVVSDMSLY